MLRVRRLKRYHKAKYPRKEYTVNEPNAADDLIKRCGVSLLVMSIIETVGSCYGGSGPPPVMPDLVTETEARQIITRVFGRYGISLDENYPLVLRSGANDSIRVNVDGFNDSLRVGYEYYSEQDYNPFNNTADKALNDSAQASGPYVKTLDGIPLDSPYRVLLERRVEAFIDSLKSHGII